MENLGYYNGDFGPIDEMCVPFNDRVHFFGDGVYEATLAKNYKIYALDEHIERLFKSASMLDIKVPNTKSELAEIIKRLVSKLDSDEQLVYFQVTRGTGARSHTYPDDMVGNLWIMLRPMKMMDIYKDIDAITLPDTRYLHCNIKTLNLIPSVIYAQKAKMSNAYEAILYREGGRVTECSHSNVHIIDKNGIFRTAPKDNLILPGISRANLIKACYFLGIEVIEEAFTLEEMLEADEILTSSSTAPIMRCRSVDGKAVGGRCEEKVIKLREWVSEDFKRATE